MAEEAARGTRTDGEVAVDMPAASARAPEPIRNASWDVPEPSASGLLSQLSGRSEGAPTRGRRSSSHACVPLRTDPDVEVVVPVYNEQLALEPSIRRLHAFLSDGFPFTWSITIADNASTDGTPFIAADLARELPEVRHLRLERKGRGLALREAWSRSDARVVSYMDVDLSTDLRALLPLVAPLLSGHSDVAIGSRLARGAHVTRGPKRELISRSYNKILKASLRVNFTDAQCGFKAVTSEAAALLLPQIRDDGWFFDTELLVLAQRAGCGPTRSRSTGSTTRTRAWTSSGPRSTTCAASRGWRSPRRWRASRRSASRRRWPTRCCSS